MEKEESREREEGRVTGKGYSTGQELQSFLSRGGVSLRLRSREKVKRGRNRWGNREQKPKGFSVTDSMKKRNFTPTKWKYN